MFFIRVSFVKKGKSFFEGKKEKKLSKHCWLRIGFIENNFSFGGRFDSFSIN